MKNSLFSSQRGNALITAIMSIAAVIGLAYIVQSVSDTTNKRVNITRAKTIMTLVEYKVRSLAVQPSSYQNCDSNIGATSCNFKISVLSSINLVPVPGARCQGTGTPTCGIAIDLSATTLDKSDITKFIFRTKLRYTGIDFSLKEVDIAQEVPIEILQSQNYNCPDTAPIFAGFQNDKPVCRTLPAACDVGKYIKAINPSTLEFTCASISTASAGCGSTQFISKFIWNGEANLTTNCVNRLNPYTVTTWWTPPPPPPPPPPITIGTWQLIPGNTFSGGMAAIVNAFYTNTTYAGLWPAQLGTSIQAIKVQPGTACSPLNSLAFVPSTKGLVSLVWCK